MKKRQKRVRYQRVRYDSAETMARREVSKALRKGTIIKPSACQSKKSPDCSQATTRLEAHHYKGYDPQYWTTIIWVCPACHTLLDDEWRLQHANANDTTQSADIQTLPDDDGLEQCTDTGGADEDGAPEISDPDEE